MKAAAFDYMRARDVAEACAALAQGNGKAKLLAGGQSLGPMLNLRLARPKLLIDVSRIQALAGIEDKADAWHIGAGVTHSRLEDAAGKLGGGAMLAHVAGGIAYRAVRNRGTIGGSLAHADPAADWPLALAALDAAVVIRGRAGSRRVAADQFMKSAFTTELAADEIVEAIIVPKLSAGARWGYHKFCRKTGEFPEASAACVLDPERRLARIYVGALTGAPQPLAGLARAAAERGLAACTREAIHEAVAAAAPQLDAIDRRMHAGVVARALQKTFQS